MRARLVAAVTLTIALATRAGAAAAGIADIVTMPDAYVGRTVTVVGVGCVARRPAKASSTARHSSSISSR